ncbi:uncharacterized protein [Hetaerina americana]|uniref:uncharacterized protein n=1 Tax=Hetaerina americana TaxID=62018 RepID=UPI003A7F5679
MDCVVPWTYKEEWKAVGELVYSQDVKKLKEAYRVLRSWKSRCLKLPAGAECTVIILEALLLENEMKDIPELHSHNILASCYAMALTRFLNLASSFEKEKTYFSMYRIARHLNLPEWIVNLRHQSSHGLELPSLVVLKAGLTLALDWLDREYWKSGRSQENLESSNSLLAKFRQRFSSLVISYQDIMKLKMSRNKHQREEGISSLNSIMKTYVIPNDDDWRLEYGSNEEIVDEVPRTLNEGIAIIVNKLQTMLKAAKNKSLDIGLLLEQFLCDSLFLPTEDSFNLYSDDLNRNILPKEMIMVWCTFLEEVIHKESLLTTFIEKLIDFKSKQEMPEKWAAIWVKYLASFLRNTRVRKMSPGKRKMSIGHLSRKVEDFTGRKEGKQLQWTIIFDENYLPKKAELNALIEDVIRNPRKSTLVYLRELLGLYEKPFSDQKAAMIEKAIEIQLQINRDSALKEIADIKVDAEEIEEFCSSVLSPGVSNGERKVEHSGFTDFSFGWENLPLGVCPSTQQSMGAEQDNEEGVVYFCE